MRSSKRYRILWNVHFFCNNSSSQLVMWTDFWENLNMRKKKRAECTHMPDEPWVLKNTHTRNHHICHVRFSLLFSRPFQTYCAHHRPKIKTAWTVGRTKHKFSCEFSHRQQTHAPNQRTNQTTVKWFNCSLRLIWRIKWRTICYWRINEHVACNVHTIERKTKWLKSKSLSRIDVTTVEWTMFVNDFLTHLTRVAIVAIVCERRTPIYDCWAMCFIEAVVPVYRRQTITNCIPMSIHFHRFVVVDDVLIRMFISFMYLFRLRFITHSSLILLRKHISICLFDAEICTFPCELR